MWTHSKQNNLVEEQSEKYDCGVSKAKVLLGWIYCKAPRQQLDPFSCWVVAKKLEIIT